MVRPSADRFARERVRDPATPSSAFWPRECRILQDGEQGAPASANGHASSCPVVTRPCPPWKGPLAASPSCPSTAPLPRDYRARVQSTATDKWVGASTFRTEAGPYADKCQ